MIKRIVFLLVLLLLGLGAAYWTRNPERGRLDNAVRRSAPGRFVALSDGLTHYLVEGPDSGQRVVLSHGFSVPSYIWDSTAKALTDAGFRVARYDNFGRGFSDRPNVAYSVDLYDRQLGELLDSLGWRDPVDLVGLSMGGITVGAFAGRHPNRVRSVTMIDPAAGSLSAPAWYFKLPVLGSMLWQILAVPQMAEGQFSDFVDPSKWPDWADRYRVQMKYRGFGRALLRTRLGWSSLNLDTLYARVGATKTRAMLLWGTEDQTVPITLAADLRKAIPGIEYHEIPGAGHLPHMERTDLVNPLLISFLRPPPPPPPPPAVPPPPVLGEVLEPPQVQ